MKPRDVAGGQAGSQAVDTTANSEARFAAALELYSSVPVQCKEEGCGKWFIDSDSLENHSRRRHIVTSAPPDDYPVDQPSAEASEPEASEPISTIADDQELEHRVKEVLRRPQRTSSSEPAFQPRTIHSPVCLSPVGQRSRTIGVLPIRPHFTRLAAPEDYMSPGLDPYQGHPPSGLPTGPACVNVATLELITEVQTSNCEQPSVIIADIPIPSNELPDMIPVDITIPSNEFAPPYKEYSPSIPTKGIASGTDLAEKLRELAALVRDKRLRGNSSCSSDVEPPGNIGWCKDSVDHTWSPPNLYRRLPSPLPFAGPNNRDEPLPFTPILAAVNNRRLPSPLPFAGPNNRDEPLPFTPILAAVNNRRAPSPPPLFAAINNRDEPLPFTPILGYYPQMTPPPLHLKLKTWLGQISPLRRKRRIAGLARSPAKDGSLLSPRLYPMERMQRPRNSYIGGLQGSPTHKGSRTANDGFASPCPQLTQGKPREHSFTDAVFRLRG